MSVGRLAAVALWLFAGHLAAGGVYWALLNVPESNVAMLIASTLLALLLVLIVAVVNTSGLLWLRPDGTLRRALARSLRLLPAFLLALAVWLLVRWVCQRLVQVHETRGSELDAWLIATFDWTRTAWLHRTIDYVLAFVQHVIGSSLAVNLLAAAAGAGTATGVGAGAGVQAAAGTGAATTAGAVTATDTHATAARGSVKVKTRSPWTAWIARALSPLQLVIVAVAIFGLMWLPWRAVYWRPASLPANSMQVAFAIVKLLVLGYVMHIGWALVLWSPQRQAVRRPLAAPPVTDGPAASEVTTPAAPSNPA